MRQVLGIGRLRRDRVQLLADALDDAFLYEVLADELRYSAVREVLPARRMRTFDVQVEEFHTFVADDVVVHNCAPPFRQAEFDILYNIGISREGSLIDIGVDNGIVRKSGAWYTYEGDQLGQGKENVRNFLRDNPDLANEIEKKIKDICDAALERNISVDDNLFEIGASSLKLIEIHEQIDRTYPGLVDLTELFDFPTIAELSAHLEGKLAATA